MKLNRINLTLGFLGYAWLMGCQTPHESQVSLSQIDGKLFPNPVALDGRVYLPSKEFNDRLVKAEKYWLSQHKQGGRNAPELISYKIALKKYKEAESMARYNLLLNFEDEESLYFLGVSHLAQGHFKLAEATFLSLGDSNNRAVKSDAFNALGLLAWQKKNWEEASSKFDDALKISENNSSARLNRAFLALAFNNPDKAETLLKEIASIEGAAFDDARFHYGVAQSLNTNKDAAIDSYESVSDYKKSPMTLLNIAIAYFNAGEDDDASDFLRRYIKQSSAKTLDARRTAALSRGLNLRKGKEALTDEEIRKLASSMNASDKAEDNGFSIMTEAGSVPMD